MTKKSQLIICIALVYGVCLLPFCRGNCLTGLRFNSKDGTFVFLGNRKTKDKQTATVQLGTIKSAVYGDWDVKLEGVFVSSGDWIKALKFQINNDSPSQWSYTDTFGVKVNDRNLEHQDLNNCVEIRVTSDLDYIRTFQFKIKSCVKKSR